MAERRRVYKSLKSRSAVILNRHFESEKKKEKIDRIKKKVLSFCFQRNSNCKRLPHQ